VRTSDFTFELPEKLVAQHPPAARSDARLLHLDGDGRTAHRRFPDLPSLLRPDDLLVRNVTRVIPARVPARKEVGGGRVEVFILPEGEGPGGLFRALTRPALRPGVRLLAGEGHPVRLEVGTDLGGGQREVRIVSGAAGVLESDGIAGSTSLLILPGHRFRVVSAMLTNFHLPGSSLLMLVAALGGTEAVLAAYREAVRERYRFYSYGDAMFVEKGRADSTSRAP